MRGLEEIRMLRLMTSGAYLDLGGRRLYRVLGRMKRVTARARDVTRRVGAGCPVMCSVRLVAGKTLRILLVSRRERFWSEVDHARERSAPCCRVRAARPVTGLAL